ncbi:MAG TPA: peroxiredoxin family protein [bacterium]
MNSGEEIKRKHIHPLSAVIMGTISLTLLLSYLSCKSGKTSIPEVGEHAPVFSLNDFSGEKFSLSRELKNNKAVLLWFTNLCKGCQRKIPEMEKIKNIYEKKGIEVVAISVLGEDRNTVENAIQQNKITLRFLYDPKGRVTELFSGKYYPGTCPLKNIFIIGKEGKILYANHYPGTEESEIMNTLEMIKY